MDRFKGFPKEHLKRYREAVVHKEYGPQLKKTVAGIKKKGYMVHGSDYKRVPQGFDASHELAEFLLYNGLSAMIEGKIPKESYSGSIVNYAYSHFKKMYPRHECLLKVIG